MGTFIVCLAPNSMLWNQVPKHTFRVLKSDLRAEHISKGQEESTRAISKSHLIVEPYDFCTKVKKIAKKKNNYHLIMEMKIVRN